MSDLIIKPFDIKLHTIHISGMVCEEMLTDLIDKINEIKASDEEVILNNQPIYDAIGHKGVRRPPIKIYLSTFGGYVYDGLGIYDLIKNLRETYDVDIICTGKIMSMGISILMAGDRSRRYALPSTTFMIHQLSDYMYGKLEDIKDDVKENERLEQLMDSILLQETDLTREQLTDIYEHKKDWYISAEEALKLGLISKIL